MVVSMVPLVNVYTPLLLDRQKQVYSFGGGFIPHHAVGTYIGAPHWGQLPTCVLFIN